MTALKRVTFSIPGEPVGKGRPRFNRATGRTYTPERTASYENLVKLEYEKLCGNQGFGESPVGILVTAYYAIPKSASKAKRKAMERDVIRPTKKPDCDNILKTVCDALNGLAYKDDSQVVLALIDKHYAEVPHVDVTLNAMESEGESNDD